MNMPNSIQQSLFINVSHVQSDKTDTERFLGENIVSEQCIISQPDAANQFIDVNTHQQNKKCCDNACCKICNDILEFVCACLCFCFGELP